MADTLIVQLIPPISRTDDEEHGAIDCAARWLYLSDENTPATSSPKTGELSRLLAEPPADCRWLVLLPGEDVVTTTVKLPKKRRRQALKALPFMLEDSIASDVALEHLAVGPDNAQDETLVAITRKEQVRDVLQLFFDAGITPYQVLPDYAMLQTAPDSWQILVDGDRAMVRCPDNTGFSTSLARLPLLLSIGKDSESGATARTLKVIRSGDTTALDLPGNWQIEEQLVAGPLQHFAADISDASLNLLQGEFRVM